MSRQSDFASRVYNVALDAGLPDHLARLAATQASLETGYGKSVKGNNFFGTKAGSSWKGKTQNLTTHEEYNGKRVKIKDQFRAYDDPADSLRDWAETLKYKFPDAYNSRDLDGAIAGLQTGVYGAYATDSKYGSKLRYINKNFVGKGKPRYASTPIQGLPPQRPQTALAAIESLSPTTQAPQSKMSYASVPRPQKASIFDMASAANNAKKFRAGEKNKFSSTGYGAQKVASAVGNSILDTGQSLWGGAQKALTPQKPVNLPRPRPTRTASTKPVALPRPRPQQDPRFDFSSMGNQSPPALQMALDMKVASLNNPIPSQPKIATPRSTRNFDRAEAGFNVPFTRQVGKATINPIDPIQPIQPIPTQSYAGLNPPPRPQGLGTQMNGLQRTVNNVRGALAPIRNVRHDIAGQIDGLKLAARRAAQQQIQQALGNRPSHMISLDRAASSGNIVHSNGYIYAGSPGNFRQVGKVQGNDAKMYSTSNEKPKGYRYQEYDSNLDKMVWKTK